MSSVPAPPSHQERKRLKAMLGATQSSTVSAEDIKAMVIALQDITATLAEADPAEKAKVFRDRPHRSHRNLDRTLEPRSQTLPLA